MIIDVRNVNSRLVHHCSNDAMTANQGQIVSLYFSLFFSLISLDFP